MDVYEFDKCLRDRWDESMEVLSFKEGLIAPSQVRTEWSYYIELQIEPTGWNAVWKIPRVICEELNLRFPTIVFGMVEQVMFKELKALFVIQAVQDDDVHLPEQQEVNLEDLWPTKMQENPHLNVEKTADHIDRLRFFYNHVWMPWDNDNDEDLDWVQKHLESRIRFFNDLNKKEMNRSLVAHIRILLEEAQYIQQKREYLEIGISDDEEVDSTLDKTQITDLMRLHLRLAMIKNEIELLENPEMRKIYENTNYDHEKEKDSMVINVPGQNISYVVTVPSTIDQQISLMSAVKKLLTKDSPVQMCPSLLDVLEMCKESDNIFLPPGKHRMKFLQCLKENGAITGITGNNEKHKANSSHISSKSEVVIMSQDDDTNLLVLDGNYSIANVTFDCRNIRTGILIKDGEIKLSHCRIIGNGRSSTQQGIVCTKYSKLIMENCIIESFSSGLLLSDEASVTLKNCSISKCRIGFDVETTKASLHFENTKVIDSAKCGFYLETSAFDNQTDPCRLILKQLSDIKGHLTISLPWSGECSFHNCAANIFILKNQFENVLPKLFDSGIIESNEEGLNPRRKALEFNNIDMEIKCVDDCEVIELDDSVNEMSTVQ